MTDEAEPVGITTVGPAGEGTETRTPRPRRRRRGGRGRGRSASPGAASREDAATPEHAEKTDTEETSAGPKTVPDDAIEAAPRGTVSGAARRRRRRGGAGGSRSTTAAAARPESPTEVEGEARSEGPEAPAAVPPMVAGEGEAAKTLSRSAKRRRRRRRKAVGETASPGTEAEGAPTGEPAPAETDGEPKPAAAPRRRARRTAAATKATTPPLPEATKEPAADRTDGAAEAGPEEPARPSRRRRKKGSEPAPAATVAGPTRLRRGGAAGARRRREPLPVVPRVTDKLMVITEHGERDQIAILEGTTLVQHYVTRAGARSMVGNVYLGRVQNVLPGMEAAFVDVGRGRNAVLYAGEVNYSPEDLEGAPPRIEQVLKSGQSVLVQVTKDPIGGKGARLTAQISMPGRYLVLVPNSDVTGISRRLPDGERQRLKLILRKIRPEKHGVIVRTAAEDAAEDALTADLARLLEEWKAIEKRAKKAKAPSLLYEEPELTVRSVRDLFNDEEFRELVTDSPRVYQLVTQYLAGIAPDLLPKVRLHQGRLPVFEEFHVVEQIHKGLDRKVWLPSGGYIVIDRTEALTVIDVNTGKSVGRTNLEETVVNTNLEAAREAARQLRLRDIGGMIIIDFIDMLLEQNKQKVVDALREEMAKDKTRSQVFDISPLGLLEVTRKRVSGGLLESFSETCPTCEGRGVLVTYQA
jgi:ribonuclease E